MQHIFTIDVEDWYHGFPPSFFVGKPVTQRLDWGMNILLDVLEEFNVKATFFWLASHAEEYPALLRRTFEQGHEIGCHGNTHEPIYKMSPSRFTSDLDSALSTLSNIVGIPIECYRAPYFSIRTDTLWAIEILREQGIRFDSSILPMHHWRTGIPNMQDKIHTIETNYGLIIEVPITTTLLAGKRLPTSGGGYFRAYPYWLTDHNLSASEASGKPVVFYIHPWEMDKDHPRINGFGIARSMHYLGLETTYQKLRKMLQYHKFGPLMKIADTYMNSSANQMMLCQHS